MSDAHTKLEFIKLEGSQEGYLATLMLNRPEHANAFSSEMLDEIPEHIKTVQKKKNCRALVITSFGKNFSGGADLSWMQASAKLSYEDNIKDAARLSIMFESIANLDLPSVAIVRGSAYGGAVGLIACCDFAIAHEQSKFCLSEARLGLLPAVIMPYLGRKLSLGQLRRLALTSRVFYAQEAKDYGLVEVVAGSDFDTIVESELNQLLSCGPAAQCAIYKLISALQYNGFKQDASTQQAIAVARTGDEGQAGLAAFFAKKPAPWIQKMPTPKG